MTISYRWVDPAVVRLSNELELCRLELEKYKRAHAWFVEKALEPCHEQCEHYDCEWVKAKELWL